MKLRNLNGAIRKVEGAPTVGVMTPLGYIHVPVQKTGLLEALKALSDDPQIETHMEVSEDGRLTVTEEGRALIEGTAKPIISLIDADAVTNPELLDDDTAREEIEDEDESLAEMTNGSLHDANVERFCGAAASGDDLDELLG